MSTLTTAEVVAQLGTTLSTDVLQAIIDREEAALTRLYGPAYDGTAITETILFESGQELYLRRRIGSITSVSQKASITDTTATTLVANSDYVAFSDEGRLLRLSSPGQSVVVVYVPVDDTEEWKRVTLELVRLAIERTSFKSENIAGEYSYTAHDNWEGERAKLLRQFGFARI